MIEKERDGFRLFFYFYQPLHTLMLLLFQKFRSMVVLFATTCQILAAQDVSEPKLNTLGYNVQNVSSFINKEYNSDLLNGFTLGGTWLKAGLSYTINKQLTLSSNLFYHHFFGDTISAFRHPVSVKVIYTPISNLAITIGDIYSIHNHHLPIILYDPDKGLTDPIEEGVSVAFKNSLIEAETWVDWEKFIVSGSPFREEFTFGTSALLHPLVLNNFETLLNFNLLFNHKGGEIDDSPLSVQTLLNARIGLDVRYNFSNKTGYLSAGADYYTFQNNSGNPELPIKKGNALTLFCNVKYKAWQFDVNFAQLNQFYAPKGDPYFSNYLKNEVVKARNIGLFAQNWCQRISPSAFFRFNNTFLLDFSNSSVDLYSSVSIIIDIGNAPF